MTTEEVFRFIAEYFGGYYHRIEFSNTIILYIKEPTCRAHWVLLETNNHTSWRIRISEYYYSYLVEHSKGDIFLLSSGDYICDIEEFRQYFTPEELHAILLPCDKPILGSLLNYLETDIELKPLI